MGKNLDDIRPLLKKYGFGATFFPCNFDAKWRKKYANTLMDKDDLKALQDMGFEIGNHTDNHRGMTKLDKALAMDVISQDEDDSKLSVFQKKLDNFEEIRSKVNALEILEEELEKTVITQSNNLPYKYINH